MQEAKIIIRITAPEGCRKPFCVTLSSTCGEDSYRMYVKANEEAVFSVPEGHYMLRADSAGQLSPGRQCKWLHAKPGCTAAYAVIFSPCRWTPEQNVRFTLEDAYYPGIISINGGITVWQRSAL